MLSYNFLVLSCYYFINILYIYINIYIIIIIINYYFLGLESNNNNYNNNYNNNNETNNISGSFVFTSSIPKNSKRKNSNTLKKSYSSFSSSSSCN